MTKDQVKQALKYNNYYVATTAKYLGIGRTKLMGLIKKHGIDLPKRSGVPRKWANHDTSVTNVYYKLRARCNNQNNKDYRYYGGRGIKMCPEWVDNRDAFEEYCKTLPNAFKAGYSIDRIDNNRNYEPGNIRFVKHKAQCNNRRSNRLYTFNGETKTIAQWADEHNLKWEFVRDRLKLGWTIEEALTIPKGVRRDSYKCNKS